jgi:hypothetical protein
VSNRFYSPFPQFVDSAGAPRQGARLFSYVAEDTVKQDTFSDADLQVANDNPLILNALGQPTTAVFLSDLPYKFVLAGPVETPGSDDPPSSPIWTGDNFYITPTTAQFNSGSGNPNGSVAGTAGSAGVPASVYWDSTNNILYVATQTGSSSTAVWTAVNETPTTATALTPQGRLTLTSATPVITTGVTAGTAVYYTPYCGNQVPIYNGSSFVNTTCSQLTLTLVASHVANALYDCFVFNNSGTATLVTGPAWATGTFGSGARGTGAATTELTYLSGLLVNAVSMTGRNGSTTYSISANQATYVGTILMDGTNGQISCLTAVGQSRRWGVWNAYNRIRTIMRCRDATASWTYNSATWRPANGATANNVVIVQGLSEDAINVQNSTKANGGGADAQISIGVNSSSAVGSYIGATETNSTRLMVDYKAQTIGANQFYAIESSASATSGFYGGADNMMLSVEFFA